MVIRGRRQGMGSMRELTSEACVAWPLPVDASCAATARGLYREAAAAAGLGASLACDGITMASELAANTLHATTRHTVGGRPEFWLYLGGGGIARELVCQVFDACPGWPSGVAPDPFPRPVPVEATGGRGLQVVHELSGGRWGHHLARARLGRCRGKAVWFALPAPPELDPWPAASDGGAATEWLHAKLSARGLGGQLTSR
jgi:hypothetical protein